MDLTRKLQIKPGQSVAIFNPPPGLTLPAITANTEPLTADAVIGFALRRDDIEALTAVISAARADRLAWIGYPKGGKLGTDLKVRRGIALLAVTELSGILARAAAGVTGREALHAQGADLIHAIRMWRAACHGLASLEAAGGFGLPESVDITFGHLIDALDAAFRRLGDSSDSGQPSTAG